MDEYFIKWLFIISAAIIGIKALQYILDKLGIWLESKGWLYYKKKPSSSSLGNALICFDTAFNPSAKYIIEAKKNININTVKREQDTSKDGVIIEKLDKSTNNRMFEFILPKNLNHFKNNAI